MFLSQKFTNTLSERFEVIFCGLGNATNFCHPDKRLNSFLSQVELLLVLCLQFLLFSTPSTIGPDGHSTDQTFAKKSLVGCCPRKSHLGKVFHLIRSANNTIFVVHKFHFFRELMFFAVSWMILMLETT